MSGNTFTIVGGTSVPKKGAAFFAVETAPMGGGNLILHFKGEINLIFSSTQFPLILNILRRNIS